MSPTFAKCVWYVAAQNNADVLMLDILYITAPGHQLLNNAQRAIHFH